MGEELQQKTKQKPSSNTTKNMVGAVIGAMTLLALVIQGVVGSLMTLPRLAIPPRMMPTPNAYDIYMQAAKACASARSGKKNLRLELGANDWYAGRYLHMYTDAEANALAKANARALALIHQGLNCEYMLPAPSQDERDANEHTDYEERLGRLLLVEAQTKLAQHDRNGAIRSALDAVQYGEDILHGGGSGATWTSRCIRLNALAEAVAILPQLTATEARSAAQRMEQVLSHQVPYATIMQEEDWRTQVELARILRRFDGPTQFAYVTEDAKQGAWQKWQGRAQLCLADRRELLREYTGYMNQLIACTSQRYGAHSPLPQPPASPIITSLVEYLPGNWTKNVHSLTAERRFALILALRAYRLEHGRYPDKLEALVPAYLSKLPEDPFAAQGGFGYKKDNTGYTIFDAGGQAASKK
jgi:hypothetical protein